MYIQRTSLPFIPLLRTCAHSNKTPLSLSSSSQILVHYREDRSIGSSLPEVCSHADLFLSAIGVDLHSLFYLVFSLSVFYVFQHRIFVLVFQCHDIFALCLPLALWNWKLIFLILYQSLFTFLLLLTPFFKAQSKLCSSKTLPFHPVDPSSSLVSWADVTHYYN